MKKPKPHPTLTHQKLLQALRYEPETGVFYWKASPSFNVAAGAIAGSIQGLGYRTIKIENHQVRASRLAWFYVNGSWPQGEIDHINTVRDDDRIANLRVVSRRSNVQNRAKARRDSSTGVIGVSKRGQRWRAAISVGGRIRHLGTHDTLDDARRAYLAAKTLLHDLPTPC